MKDVVPLHLKTTNTFDNQQAQKPHKALHVSAGLNNSKSECTFDSTVQHDFYSQNQ